MKAAKGAPSAVIALAKALDAMLPQTQCQRCGFAGCEPYATAMARGESDCNRCPPGGEAVTRRLAERLGVAPKPVAAECGEPPRWMAARINEEHCIGCVMCIRACPVDAIVGAAKRMHTVLEAECTGCELCLPPCPVDCIELVPMQWPAVLSTAAQGNGGTEDGAFAPAWPAYRASRARARFVARNGRFGGDEGRPAGRARALADWRPAPSTTAGSGAAPSAGDVSTAARDRMQRTVQAALARVAARRERGSPATQDAQSAAPAPCGDEVAK